MRNIGRSIPVLATIAFLVVYVISIFWINFHGALWYQMDVYTYALEGRLMHDARSFFPEGWVFSNQFHIVSSPNISALFYGFVKDSTVSMAIASSLSSLLILFSFWWCFKAFLGKSELAVGLLCLAGGIIFGRSASTYISGLQVLHTMASFYASYMIALLLSLGCWLRLRHNKSLPLLILCVVFPLNFAMGMQSLREMLVLIIPLIVMEALHFLYRLAKRDSFNQLVKRNFSLFFVIGLFVAEIAGYFYMASLDVATTPIIGEVNLDLSFNGISNHLWATTKNILRISGIAIAVDGLRYLPLSICATLVAVSIIWSLHLIIRTKDESPLAQAIVFSSVSVIGVFFVGVFLMRTRDIYFFVYWLLATLSVIYTFRHIRTQYTSLFAVTLIVISIVNFAFNFIPDFTDYHRNNEKLSEFTEKLIADGFTVVYVDATPIIAASSHDRIISQSYWLDVNMTSGYPLTVFPSDKYLPVFDDNHYQNSLICFSGYSSGYLQNDSGAYRDNLMSQLTYFDEVILGNRKFVFYKPLERVIAPLASHHAKTD